MDDFILMPPPAPRFKRPRKDNIDDDASTSAAAPKDEPTEETTYEELFCVSPDDTDDAKEVSFEDDVPFSDEVDGRDLGTIREERSADVGTADDAERGVHYEKTETKKKKSSVLIPNVSFRDIIGQGPAKLRLDEALLPLALPGDLAESVLTGAFVFISIVPLELIYFCLMEFDFNERRDTIGTRFNPTARSAWMWEDKISPSRGGRGTSRIF
jgi:hypothetical protein